MFNSKKQGYCVELLDESAQSGVEPDARINGKIYDIKRLCKAKDPRTRISRLFEKTSRMGIDKIVLHIDQPLRKSEVVAYLAEAMARRTKISELLLIFDGEVYDVTRQEILKRNWIKIQ